MYMQKLKAILQKIRALFLREDIHYINGPETLPEPLSKAEEERLLSRLSAGETDVREDLIVHNLRLVVYIAKKFENSGVNVEDLISIGTIGLIKAVNTFRPEKKIKLATYASRCIENEILMYLSSPDEIHENLEYDDEKKLLLESVGLLSDRDQMIMHMRFGLAGQKEHTQKEVAEILGISQSYISRLEKRIIARLRKEMEKAV